MKVFAGFVIGVAACLLFAWTVDFFSVGAQAAEDPAPLKDETGITSLLPDIDVIYKQALGLPYRQVRSEITDPEIAAFYDKLMEQTGLDKIGVP